MPSILCSNAQVGMNSVACSQLSCMTSHRVYLPLVCMGAPSQRSMGISPHYPAALGAAFITLSQGELGPSISSRRARMH